MAGTGSERPIAILAGGGRMPSLVAEAARRGGRAPIVFAIAGEGDPAAFGSLPVHILRWGELGRLLNLARKADCREVVFIGTISARPDLASVRPDLGALKHLPRVLKLIGRGDHSLLEGMAAIFAEQGIELVSPLDVAPDLALGEGCQAGRVPGEAEIDIEKALQAARLIGGLDIAQAAVSVGGRVVALEDVGGTDGLLRRVAEHRRSGRIGKAGGVLVKCLKPQQDGRHDLPTIGPDTARATAEAGLWGVAAEAGRTMLAGRDETIEAFRRAGLFLLGLKPSG
ncbi:MAG: LpxI family protein [Propylenella sp.]